MGLARVLAVALLRWRTCSARDPSESFLAGMKEGPPAQNITACSWRDLLPLPSKEKSSEWTSEYVDDMPYGCTCAAMKSRYYCATQQSPSYPKWESKAVTEGLCQSKTRSEMEGAPFPANSKYLFYGNSHLRQVVETIMCMHQADITSKIMNFGSDIPTTVSGETQCRSCTVTDDPAMEAALRDKLLRDGCMAETDTCRCVDSKGEFYFDNGAVVHYTFSHHEPGKSIASALSPHGNISSLSSYDAVFMNKGNSPQMSANAAVNAATKVQAAGSQLFLLSTYTGRGVKAWKKGLRTRYIDTGASYIDIESMMKGMTRWTRGAVEGGKDSHFCLPGPPDEIAVLLMTIAWALHEERYGSDTDE